MAVNEAFKILQVIKQVNCKMKILMHVDWNYKNNSNMNIYTEIYSNLKISADATEEVYELKKIKTESK